MQAIDKIGINGFKPEGKEGESSTLPNLLPSPG